MSELSINEILNSRKIRQHGQNFSLKKGPNGNTFEINSNVGNTFPGDIFGSNYPQMNPNETPEEMGQRMTDAQQNTDLGNVFVGGARDAIQGVGETISDIGNFVGLKIPPPRLPEIDQPEGVVNQIARGFVQFGTGMLASPVKGFGIGKNIIRGAFSDAYFDPEEGGFITMLREFGVGPEVLEMLDTRVGENASAGERLQGRLGNAVEGAVLGGILDTIQYIRQTPHLLQKARETIIQAGKNAEARMEGGTTLNTGINPDPLIAGAGKMLDNTRQQDKLGFYSKALDVVNKTNLNKASAQQWLGTLRNSEVKKDEMFWTGLDDFFKRKGNQTITKGEIVDYLNDNQLQLKEVRLGVDGSETEMTLEFEDTTGSYNYNIMEGEEIYHEANYIRDDLDGYVRWSETSESEKIYDGIAFLELKSKFLQEFNKEDLLSVGIDIPFTSPNEIQKMKLNPIDPSQPQFQGVDLPREYTFDDAIQAIMKEKWEADSDFDNLDQWFMNNKKLIEEESGIPRFILDKVPPRIFEKSQYKMDEVIEDLARERLSETPLIIEKAEVDEAIYEIYGRGDFFSIKRNGEFIGEGDTVEEARVIAQDKAFMYGDINFPEEIEEGIETVGKFDGPAQFASEGWKEEGGTNYRELLITAPNIRDATKTNFEILQGDAKTGQHHRGYKNIVSHIRITDRQSTIGNKKILYLEEVQSDWSKHSDEFKKSEEEIEATIEKRAEAQKIVDAYKQKIINQRTDLVGEELDKANQAMNYLQLTSRFATGSIDEINRVGFDKGPFVDDQNKWVNLSMKRILRMAIDEGYDAIAWTTGDIQHQRWGRRSNIKNLTVTKTDDNKYVIGEVVTPRGEILVSNKVVKRFELEKMFGSEFAQKINNDLGSAKTMQYETPNAQFEHQGMFEQYDNILVNNSKKLVKKLDKDATVKDIEIEDLGMRNGIVITDKMKESVKKGQTLFSASGPVVAGASGASAVMSNQEGNQNGNRN